MEKVVKKDDESRFYARKTFYSSKPSMRTPEYVWKIKSEALIIRRPNHRHIVQVVPTHRLATYFAIIVFHAAEKNFADLLDEIG